MVWRALRLVGAAAILATAPALAAGGRSPQGQERFKSLRFSGDGQFVLASEPDSVTVLSVRPFAVVLRMPAPGAAWAHFTPDSGGVVTVRIAPSAQAGVGIKGEAIVVERWSLVARERTGSWRLGVGPCGTLQASPDGATLACQDMRGSFHLFDVATRRELLREDRFAATRIPWCVGGMTDPSTRGAGACGTSDGMPGSAMIEFSPDGGYVVAVPRVGVNDGVAVELSTGRRLLLRRGLARLRLHQDFNPTAEFATAPPFAFVSSNRVIVSWTQAFSKRTGLVTATLAEFPSGRVIVKPKIPAGPIFRAADPSYVIVRPYHRYGAAAVNLATGETLSSPSAALDVYGRYYMEEVAPGKVGLFERSKGLQASVSLSTP